MHNCIFCSYLILIFIVDVYCGSYIDIHELEDRRGMNTIKFLIETVEVNISRKFMNIPEDNDLKFTFERFNEDVHLNITQLIRKHGYPVETHYVTTEDGYRLSLFRIPKAGPPVLLMHGLLMSADDWVTAGPESGLAYLLASEGYDVWMGNARGNKHSRQHLRLSPEGAEFWDFSFDEIGRYDLPAMIDYVLQATGQHSLKFVGHSQGTTTFFVMCSDKPKYNDKVSLMVALAATTTVSNTRNPLIRFLDHATKFHPQILFSVMREVGYNEFLPSDLLMKTLSSVLCGKVKLATIICSNIVFLLCGFNYFQLNITNTPVIYSHTPAGAATKQIEHYAQGISSGLFERFDYGKVKNRKLYGSATPPPYLVERITVPVAIFSSVNDWIVTMADSQILRKRLQNVVDFYVVPDRNFNHLDYLFAKDVKNLVFARLLYLIKNTSE